jgi:restriction system protein
MRTRTTDRNILSKEKLRRAGNMSRKMSYSILLTGIHFTETFIPPEGDYRTYTIAPTDNLKKGDTVYLWCNIRTNFYGWGIVAETPRDFIEEDSQKKRRRMSVLVNRVKGFYPRITETMMRQDTNLKNMIPMGFDDLYAIPLRPGQAHYLNDCIREHNLEAPQGSTTTHWLAQENAPTIILQAILTYGDKTKEGQVVEGVRIAWDEIIRVFANDPEEIYRVDPRKFEEIIAGAYVRDGYEVELTPPSGDKGRDVIAMKRDRSCSIRIFDQVKRYKISRPVTAEEVRALVGVLTMDSNVSKGIITTTSTFAPTLLNDENIKRLVPYRLELRPRDVLLPWLQGLRKF